MSEVVLVERLSYGNPTSDLINQHSRLFSADMATDQDTPQTTFPLRIPKIGEGWKGTNFNYSYYRNLCLRIYRSYLATISNVKYYITADPLWEWGTGGELRRAHHDCNPSSWLYSFFFGWWNPAPWIYIPSSPIPVDDNFGAFPMWVYSPVPPPPDYTVDILVLYDDMSTSEFVVSASPLNGKVELKPYLTYGKSIIQITFTPSPDYNVMINGNVILRTYNPDGVYDQGATLEMGFFQAIPYGVEGYSGAPIEDPDVGNFQYCYSIVPVVNAELDTIDNQCLLDSQIYTTEYGSFETKSLILQAKIAIDAVQGTQPSKTLTFSFDEW